MDLRGLADAIAAELRDRATPGRAEREKAYLKSPLEHLGTSVPAIRAVAKDVAGRHPALTHEDVVGLVDALWSTPVHERRLAAVELLRLHGDRLGPEDLPLLGRLLRQGGTWALVDPLATAVVGPVLERHPELSQVLDRWAADDDFWLHRASLLALLPALRRGEGDFARFSAYADQMLAEREFYLRKAIGCVLRDTARRRPDLVYRWLLPRARRASGVTVREAVKPMSEQQRAAILGAR
ncbi:MAG TPA: DNA alkylation repair protein [Acidimicrobiales bacterium]|nr:DNA alkylation repair protein [Acidimicrobiales bacterium]